MLIYVVDKTIPAVEKNRALPRKVKLKADVYLAGRKPSDMDGDYQLDVRLNCDLGPAGRVVIGFVISKNDLQDEPATSKNSINFRR